MSVSVTNSQPVSPPNTTDDGASSRPVAVWEGRAAVDRAHELAGVPGHPARDLRWLSVLRDGLQQQPYLLEIEHDNGTPAILPLAFVKSVLFGRFLVGLPYLNSGGIDALDPETGRVLIDAAVELADRLDCRHLELRHESACPHPAFNAEMTHKVHMRLALPESEEALWDSLKSKVRSQVRKALTQPFTVEYGQQEFLPDFYGIFSRRMHELGTPVYSQRLFASILQEFGEDAEIVCIRDGAKAIATALLVHGRDVTEVPSASTLTAYNPANANMFLYWHLLCRAVARGRRTFDFGRSTKDSGTFRFKKQWGAEAFPSCWQYYVRQGSADALRPDNAKNQRRIEMWKKLPLWVTRLIGPRIVRGIP